MMNIREMTENYKILKETNLTQEQFDEMYRLILGTLAASESEEPAETENVPQERLNLKIPADLKEYLITAASMASIEQRKRISLTEYLCGLIRADMQKKK